MEHGPLILGFGAVAMDELIFVDRAFAAGKGKVKKRARAHGGNIATALVAAARLGSRVGFIGWLGDQDESAADLESHGVDTSMAPRLSDAKPIRSVILVAPDGARFIAYDDEVPHGTSETLSDAVLAQASVLLVDAYAVHSLAVVARARALGAVVVADIEWSTGDQTETLLLLCDHLVVPMRFAEERTRGRAVAELIDSLWSPARTAVVLTDGERGSYVRQRGEQIVWHVPALRVRAVDTTGAGDCFHGAYAHALAAGQTPLDCVRFASIAAAISVTGEGGRVALPTAEACLALSHSSETPRPMVVSTGSRSMRPGLVGKKE